MMFSKGQSWRLILGDCIEEMARLEEGCIHHSIHSPPFPAIFSYTSSAADIGNSEDFRSDVKIHLSYYLRQLARVLMSGRVALVHVMQVPRMKRIERRGGLHDFRGLIIRLAERAGLIYDYDWVVRKNPQAQALRTKSHCLQFAGLERDRAQSRGALGDYLIKLRKPGDNPIPIDSKGEVSRNEWIEWAECCWRDISETDTLNVKAARGPDDIKHICPLQLSVIRRSIKLYSNPGEIVLSPFAGIGSEGHCALELGRRFLGIELKPEYHAAAQRNLEAAERAAKASQRTLFDAADA